MTTRISSAHLYDATIASLMDRQRDLSETQRQLTTGKRINRASDDPAAAARAERAQARELRTDANLRAVQASRSNMELTESTLGSATELLQQARETILAAGNASYSDAERANLGDSLRSIRAQLLVLANSTDGAGRALFGGQGASAIPFIDAPGGVQFRGSPGELAAGGEPGLVLAMDGQGIWLSAPSGNGVFETRAITSTGSAWIDAGSVTDPASLTGSAYSVQFAVAAGVTTYSVLKDGAPTALSAVPYVSGSPIQIDGIALRVHGSPADGDAFDAVPSTPSSSAFDVLDRAAAALRTPLRSASEIQQGLSQDLRDIDAVFGHLTSARSQAGGALNRMDGTDLRLGDAKLQAQGERSDAEDLDMVQALSAFQAKQVGYDAALRAYSSVQRLSLFQYINP
ncbi:MAG: flagellar hook-associated protein FlgL [Burkholderiaceae bacterium]